MKISQLGFTFFNSSFEDSASIQGSLPSIKSYPSISPRPSLTVTPSYSLLFHHRLESIKSALWKTSPSSKSRTKSKETLKKQNLRKQILNCPPSEMLALLASQGLLSDGEPISSSSISYPKTEKKEQILPSIPPTFCNNKKEL